MAGTAPKTYDIDEYKPAPETKHIHHGRTAAAWVGSAGTLIAFIVGAIGLVIGSWPVFWAAAVLLLISIIATVILQRTGRGAV